MDAWPAPAVSTGLGARSRCSVLAGTRSPEGSARLARANVTTGLSLTAGALSLFLDGVVVWRCVWRGKHAPIAHRVKVTRAGVLARRAGRSGRRCRVSAPVTAKPDVASSQAGDRGSAGSLAAARVPAGQAGRGPCREASAGGGCGCDAAVPPATDLGVSLTRRAGPGPAHPQRAAARQAHRLRGFPRKLTGPEPRTHLGALRTGASRNAKCLFSTMDGLSTSAFPAERAMVKRAYVKCSMCILFLSVPLSE